MLYAHAQFILNFYLLILTKNWTLEKFNPLGNIMYFLRINITQFFRKYKALACVLAVSLPEVSVYEYVETFGIMAPQVFLLPQNTLFMDLLTMNN